MASEGEKRGLSRIAGGIWGVLLVLGLFLGIHAFQPARYHGDERFYTDGAIQMLESGVYGVPRFADGTLGFINLRCFTG